jgi:DNA invertase Pin-like site-specific DNA recombinase
MMAMNLVNFAQYERELISERTKAALAAKKRRGERIGRPRVASPAIVRCIVIDRDGGLSFDAIARVLTG